MPPHWNAAVDTLAENLRWLLTQRGLAVMKARTEYLIQHSLTSSDVDDATRTLVAILSEAEPVFWPRQFCDVVEQSFSTMPTSWRMTDPMLFTTHGFMHFEQPISLVSSHPDADVCMGSQDAVTALAWRKLPGTVFVDFCAWVQPGDRSIMEVFPAGWLHPRISESVRQRLGRLIKKAHDREQQESHPLLPDRGVFAERLIDVISDELDHGDQEPYRQLLMEAHRDAGVLRSGGVPWFITTWRSGQTVDQTMAANNAAFVDEAQSCSYCSMAYLRLMATSLNFLSTKVFVSVPSQTDRTVLRRLARNNAHRPQWNSVNVVSMRRIERATHKSDEEHAPVNWSCHWIVGGASGGFWRHQPIKNAEGQWTYYWRWIYPYVKGDLSKPLKPVTKKVFDVVR